MWMMMIDTWSVITIVNYQVSRSMSCSRYAAETSVETEYGFPT